MRMNKISARQLYFFLACIAPVGKLVIMPSRLAQYSGNDLLIPVLFHYLLQTAIVFAVLLLAKRGKNLFEMMEESIGKIASSIVVLILSLFLFYAAFLPLLEQKVFVQGVFYDTIPSLVAFAPFFPLAAYLCSKPLSSYGRTWDVLGPIALVGFFGILVLSLTETDFGSLLPIGSSGAKGIFGGAVYTFSWFFDSVFLLFLLGKIDYRKGMAWKGALFYLAGGLAVIFYIAVYYAIFQETAVNQLFAFTKTSKFFSGITVLGRVDFIFIYALAFVMIFYCSLPLQAGIDGILQVFGKKRYLPTILSVILNGAIAVLIVIFDYRFGQVMYVISEKLFWLFPIFTVAVPLLSLCFRRKKSVEST